MLKIVIGVLGAAALLAAAGCGKSEAEKKREAAASFLRSFADDVKKSGLVKQIIDKHGVRGVTVAQ